MIWITLINCFFGLMSTRRPRISGDTSQQQGPKKQQGRRGAECLGNQRGYKGDLSNHKHFEGYGRSKYPKTYCYIVWFKISTDTELVFLWFETFPSEVCWYWFWLFPCTSWVLSFNWVVSWLWSNIFFWDVHLVEVDRRLFQTIWKRHFAGRHPYSSLFIHHKNP